MHLSYGRIKWTKLHSVLQSYISQHCKTAKMKILWQYGKMNHMRKLAHLCHPIVWYKYKILSRLFEFAELEHRTPDTPKISTDASTSRWLDVCYVTRRPYGGETNLDGRGLDTSIVTYPSTGRLCYQCAD